MTARATGLVLASIVGSIFGSIVGSILAVVLAAVPACAHDRSTSYAAWEIGAGGARVTVRLTALEASRLPRPADDPVDDTQRLGAYLTSRVRLSAGDTPCSPVTPPQALAAPVGRLALEWRVACPVDGPLRIESTAFLDLAPSHLHFVRVRWADGRTAERVLSDAAPSWMLGGGGAPSFGAAVRLGIEHILSGADHLAFLLALLLLGGTMFELAQVVTGFTVAHSVTLALAALGLVRPEQAPVEALIGLSVAVVAAENVWLAGARGAALPLGLGIGLLGLGVLAAAGLGQVPAAALAGLALFTACHMLRLRRAARPLRLRWSAAFAFGLLHGFGFAAVLVDAALPAPDLARMLLGFNVGVELGQLAVLALVLPLVLAAGRWRPVVVDVGSAAVAGLGVFWFVSRAYG